MVGYKHTASKDYYCHRCAMPISAGSQYITYQATIAEGKLYTTKRVPYCLACFDYLGGSLEHKARDQETIQAEIERKALELERKAARKPKRRHHAGHPLLVGHCTHGLGRMQG